MTSASTLDVSGRHLDATRCGARVKVFDLRARNARAGGGGGRLERLAETAGATASLMVASFGSPCVFDVPWLEYRATNRSLAKR